MTAGGAGVAGPAAPAGRAPDTSAPKAIRAVARRPTTNVRDMALSMQTGTRTAGTTTERHRSTGVRGRLQDPARKRGAEQRGAPTRQRTLRAAVRRFQERVRSRR